MSDNRFYITTPIYYPSDKWPPMPSPAISVCGAVR